VVVHQGSIGVELIPRLLPLLLLLLLQLLAMLSGAVMAISASGMDLHRQIR
jgi:hypothetical protein